jgi:cation transport ATPase
VKNFKNINGEGIVSELTLDSQNYEVICGNERLMRRYEIDLDINKLPQNITELE